MNRILIFLPLFLSVFFVFFNIDKTQKKHQMTLCGSENQDFQMTGFQSGGNLVTDTPVNFAMDPSLSYAMPMLTAISEQKTMLTWTEKDEKGEVAFCLAFSENNDLNFSDKKVIFRGMGIGNSRMMRAKVLVKKDGKLVAVFSNREEVPAEPGKRPKRASNIVYCESVDNGNTWTSPKAVDTDPAKLVRGFFDAIVLPNDEIAVVYLKDVENSTKHEERNLRLALTKNGVFQPERIIDPVVCDCCPINLYLDKNQHLNVIYRDNNNDIRDMARMVSKDNGLSFSKPEIVYQDNWKIAGCPHQGAVSTQNQKEGYLIWFTGAENEQGYRLTTLAGKKLAIIDEASAKEPWLTSNKSQSVMIWQQNKNDEQLSMVAFKKLANGVSSETQWLENSSKTMNVSGILLEKQLLIAREVLGENKKNTLAITKVNI
jgi:hypothetical protein